MMNYELFKEIVEDHFAEYLSEGLADHRVGNNRRYCACKNFLSAN